MSVLLSKNGDKTAVISLEGSMTNPINSQLVMSLRDTLQNIRQDPNINSIVITSTNDKFFSIGLDIPELFEMNRDEFTIFYKDFNQLCMEIYSFPKPVIAGITGHATAGGCVLALCCDYRIIAEGKKYMGLNEVKLGVPVPYPCDCMLRDLIGSRLTHRILMSGDFYLPDKLLDLGMVDRIAEVNEVRKEAMAKAQEYAILSLQSVTMIKRNGTESVVNKINESLECKEDIFIDCWYSDSTRNRLKQAMEKF